MVLTAPSAACWLPGVNPCCTLEAGGVGGLPRPYRLANVHVSLRLAHVAHGSVPEHRIFLTLHASHARLTLGSFLRFSDASPVSGDGACSEAYDRLGVDVGAAGEFMNVEESMNGEGKSGVSVKLGFGIEGESAENADSSNINGPTCWRRLGLGRLNGDPPLMETGIECQRLTLSFCPSLSF